LMLNTVWISLWVLQAGQDILIYNLHCGDTY
jgi:hypothetical protein